MERNPAHSGEFEEPGYRQAAEFRGPSQRHFVEAKQIESEDGGRFGSQVVRAPAGFPNQLGRQGDAHGFHVPKVPQKRIGDAHVTLRF